MKNILVILFAFCITFCADGQEIPPSWLQEIASSYIGKGATIEHWGNVTNGKPYVVINPASPSSKDTIIDVRYEGMSNHVWFTGHYKSKTYSALVPYGPGFNPGTGIGCKHTCTGHDCSSCRLTVADDEPCTGGCICRAHQGPVDGMCDHSVSN